MTNKQKAEEICEKYGVSTVFPTNDECIAYSSAMEMAKWKDEVFMKVLLNIAIKFAKTAEDIKPLLNEFEELLKENDNK